MNELGLTPQDVRAARALIQWSQAELAKVADVSVSTIADFEKGLRTPIPNNLIAIRRAFESAGVQFTPAGPTIFSELSLHIMTQAGVTEMRFRYALDGAAAVQQIIATFGSAEGDGVELEPVQTASPTLKAAIDALIQQHGSAVPPLNKLKKIISSLGDNEYFLLLPEYPATTVEKLRLERYLHSLNHPEDQSADERIDDLFGLLLERYNISSPRTDQRTLIGAERDPRTCRFCGRTAAGGATFKKAAHVIPTALGNDHLKSAEECDECNGYFGCETEPSLIAMLDLQRVFLGTQGRGKNDGRPKLRFGEDILLHDGERVNIQSKSVIKDASDTFVVNLGRGAPLTPSSVYRALVKMVVSVVDEEELPHLKETIEWVRHGTHSERPLPKVASSVIPLPLNPSAQITIYTRRHSHPHLPHIVGEFRLGCYIYVFAVPFSDQDQWDLVGFFDEASFQETFKHYFQAAKWMQQDLSRQDKVVMSPRLKFVRRSS
ncbi:helix-turn-helix domain-containing protein [Methylobacterium nodulans]|uniref:Transcriptional regulator, XRE family n=1 Tax=Methylobacterium nodulans (strain LMG 21967 / CNCM I-2342 / ORS 2060) TaxID=460265 RepID=B8IVU6_METNO|nr:helix-turn-helix domain-containing protein [Methylobacterium nodulans]ACL62536.1 transcriptional regulator, XRE family [Methylobacterium nodulans ORS 2060]